MRRQYAPFNGKRYILDKKTGVHTTLTMKYMTAKSELLHTIKLILPMTSVKY